MGTYGWGEQSVAIAVVEAVAAEAQCEPDELTSLYDVIDPDALDAMLERAGDLDAPSSHRMAFFYAGYEVEVRGDGLIRVYEAPTPAGALE